MWHYEVGCAKQTIFLLVLPRNQTKAWARNLRRDRKWVRERERELKRGTQRKRLAKGDAEWQSTPDSRRDQSAWDRVQDGEGRPVKMSQHSSWLVEILQKKLHISDSLQMLKECRVSQLKLIALELTQAHIVRLFFVLFLLWLYFFWP